MVGALLGDKAAEPSLGGVLFVDELSKRPGCLAALPEVRVEDITAHIATGLNVIASSASSTQRGRRRLSRVSPTGAPRTLPVVQNSWRASLTCNTS